MSRNFYTKILTFINAIHNIPSNHNILKVHMIHTQIPFSLKYLLLRIILEFSQRKGNGHFFSLFGPHKHRNFRTYVLLQFPPLMKARPEIGPEWSVGRFGKFGWFVRLLSNEEKQPHWKVVQICPDHVFIRRAASFSCPGWVLRVSAAIHNTNTCWSDTDQYLPQRFKTHIS